LFLIFSRLLEAHPTIHDELPYLFLNGKVTVKPNVKAFFQDGVEFSDDTSEQTDVIVFATGYDYKVEFVDKDVIAIDDNRTRLYKYMYPPNLSHPTFAVIGLVQPIGAIMPISEMQCRWYSRVMNGTRHSLCSVQRVRSAIEVLMFIFCYRKGDGAFF